MSFLAYIQLLSGVRYTLEVLPKVRIFHLQQEMADTLGIRDANRIVLFLDSEEVEAEEVVVADAVYHAVVQDPPVVHLSYNGDGEIILRLNGEPLDVAGWRQAREQGRSFSGTMVPATPLTLQVEGLTEEAYRKMIRSVRKEWALLRDLMNVSFPTFYLTYGPEGMDLRNEDEEEDEEREVEELLSLEPSHHLYAYLRCYLPRDCPDAWKVEPLRIEHYEFL